jgi:hypothetical protein
MCWIELYFDVVLKGATTVDAMLVLMNYCNILNEHIRNLNAFNRIIHLGSFTDVVVDPVSHIETIQLQYHCHDSKSTYNIYV